MNPTTPKKSTNCTCGKSHKRNCSTCSAVMMRILLKNGQQEHKIGPYKNYNPTWYSFLKYNRYDKMRIAEKMEHRLRNHDLANAAQVLLFFENGNRQQPFHKIVL